MTLGDIYRKSVEVGIASDWRGQDRIDGILATARSESSGPGFDRDRLFNPYGDTRIAFGDPDTPVEAILVGIEIWPKEVLLAGLMRTMGKPVDLCISHHTSCVNRGMFNFSDILLTHKCCLAEVGVPREQYDPAVDKWLSELGSDWKLDTVNTARNLDLPLLVVHTPCDLLHVKRTRDLFARMRGSPLREIVEVLNGTEEFQQNPHREVVVHGDPEAKPGKVYNPVGAGWRPLVPLFELACQAGINTALLVEVPEEHLTVAAEYGVNVLGVPANPNCNYGINILLDELEQCAPLTIYEAENFVRVRRV